MEFHRRGTSRCPRLSSDAPGSSVERPVEGGGSPRASEGDLRVDGGMTDEATTQAPSARVDSSCERYSGCWHATFDSNAAVPRSRVRWEKVEEVRHRTGRSSRGHWSGPEPRAVCDPVPEAQRAVDQDGLGGHPDADRTRWLRSTLLGAGVAGRTSLMLAFAKSIDVEPRAGPHRALSVAAPQ